MAAKGGVYGVTKGLRDRFGAARVFDTLLDETSILGLGLGAGLAGMLPVPEIQYLAYLHNAEDQLRGEAATMQFFSQGAFRNPMVVRVAGLAYQEGFGGHFHNDNSVAVLRDIPGLVVAVPARPDDAAPMLRTCLAAAAVDGSVCVFLEPIALYHTRDLYADGDGEWLAGYAGAGRVGGRARADRPGPGLPGRLGRRPDHHHLRQRGADVAAGRGPAGRGGRRHPGGGPALAGPAAGGRHRPGGRRRPAGCWSSTRPAAPAGSARACSPPWSTPDTSARPAGWPPSTRSSRSVRPRDHVLVSEEAITAGCPYAAGTVNCRSHPVRHLRADARTVWTTR